MILIVKFFFSLILLLSLLKEIKRFDFIWSRFPVFMQFIPTWSFFAPVPNMFDYHLLYRVILSDHNSGDWKPVYSPEDRSSFFCFIWNPQKKFAKAFLDISLDLVGFSNKVEDKNQICTSLPYLQILSYIDSLCHGSCKIQFLILNNSRTANYEVAFLSGIHAVAEKEL